MKNVTVALLFLVCVIGCYTQIPRRCVSPPTWEAKSYEGTTTYARLGRLYYDADNERVSFDEEVFDSSGYEEVHYTDYFFFKEKYGLKYNKKTQMCTRFSLLNETFRRIEVSPTARFLDTYIIGTNAEEKYGLAVNVWGDTLNTTARVIMEFVADDGDGDEHCLPVSFTEFNGRPGSMSFRHQSFYDVVIGVNPDHFIPPSVCSR